MPLASNVKILAIFASVSATSLQPAVISSAADMSSVECMCSTSTLPNEPVDVAEPLTSSTLPVLKFVIRVEKLALGAVKEPLIYSAN